jgi:hypothetical protein
MKKPVCSLLFLYAPLYAWGFTAPTWVRSPRGLLMGDAYTAAVNDEFSLFYNPASLGRHQRDFTIHMINPSVSVNNVLADAERFEDIPDTPTGFADVAMNYPIHAGVGLAPGFKLFNFGMTYIIQDQVDLLMRNKISPQLDLDYRSDRGVVMGFALPLTGRRLSEVGGSQTSLGVGVKYLKRKGLLDSLSLTGGDVLEAIENSGDTDALLDSLGVVEGRGWGFDLGLEHVIRKGAEQWVFGLSGLDMTDTDFSYETNPQKKQVAANRNQVNFGVSWMLRTAMFKSTFSLDVRNLTDYMDTAQRFRVGLEVGNPIISILAGWNAGYLSYGVAIDLQMIKIIAGLYGVEAGGSYRSIQNKRAVIYFSLFDFSFDS